MSTDGPKELVTVIRQLVEFHEGLSPLTFALDGLLRGENSGPGSLADDIGRVLDDYEDTRLKAYDSRLKT